MYEIQDHSVDPNLNPSQIARIGTISAYSLALASCLTMYVADGPEKDSAIATLREAELKAVEAIAIETDEGTLADIQANAFTDFFLAFGGFFKGLFTKDAQAKIEIGISSFIGTDLGALAVDAVEYVEATLSGASGLEKRDAAVAKLKTDASAAGKNLAAFAQSTLIWFIETALQAVVAKGLSAAAEIATHV